ncbi:hypothetical protein MKX01_027485 [Papaver californicum]|nr:hypothetical protein MKX01_027485 [Papaver californicum]
MEGKHMKMGLVMVMLVLGMCVEMSSAYDWTCYDKCLTKCQAAKGRFEMKECPIMCWGKCGPFVTSSGNDYCKLGCGLSNCLNRSTRGYQVENCMNSVCAEKCNI